MWPVVYIVCMLRVCRRPRHPSLRFPNASHRPPISPPPVTHAPLSPILQMAAWGAMASFAVLSSPFRDTLRGTRASGLASRVFATYARHGSCHAGVVDSLCAVVAAVALDPWGQVWDA
jgi:hypothetical protein